MLDSTDILRLSNLILAVLSIPPSVMLLKKLVNERPLLIDGKRNLNSLLIGVFFIFVIASLSNAFLSLALVIQLTFDGTPLGDALFNFRNIIVNAGYCAISWGFWYIVNRYTQ